ncbi:hypothetical protein FT643_04125 [Ketobacter sp. MCCC 1A13808]|uniref:hypothetical protein n=1 Tax=Ketobacter sp. MCCC 1A13808 TaxID=2602738 RepID=UPI0012EC4F2C|nr:hypothetical protein [Ketobacter sp. MCCC 1A13808]MVF11325.1 hypothetical protein [Ketobacter sp. MCCC 1A13808]
MKSLFNLFWHICLFRKGPQDVPHAPALVGLLLVTLLILSALMLLALEPSYLVAKMAGSAAALFAWCAAVFGVLSFKQQSNRFAQTMTACLGSDLIISVLSIPVQIIGIRLPAESGLSSLLWFAMLMLIIWDILIKARIYSSAMELGRLQGNFLAIALWISLFIISLSFLPAQALQQEQPLPPEHTSTP